MGGFRGLLSAQSAAERLGVHVQTVRKLARTGAIPSEKHGRDWRFLTDDIEHFLSRRPRKTDPHRRTAEALRESDEKFRALAEYSSDVIMRFDLRKRHLYVNRAVEALTNIPAANFIGKTHAEIGFPPDLVEFWERAIQKTIDDGRPQRVEFQLPNRAWIDWMLTPEFDADGVVSGVMTAARDITLLKEAEKALQDANSRLEQRVAERTEELFRLNAALEAEIAERRNVEASLRTSQELLQESESRISSIADNLPGGMIYQLVRKPEGTRHFRFLSGAVSQLHGCSAEEAVADSGRVYSTVIEEDRARVLMEEEQALQAFAIFQTEVRIQKPGGEVRWSYFASRPRWLSDGSTCWDGLELDITERKKLESELRESEHRFRTLSMHDSLTGLLNRVAFEDALTAMQRDFSRCRPISFLILDVNGLKLFNDTMGHSVGDRLLVSAAEIIADSLPDRTELYRTGGDEFCIIAKNTDETEAENIRMRIHEMTERGRDGDRNLGLTFSIGVACSDQYEGRTVHEVCQIADDNMYSEKFLRNGAVDRHIDTLTAALDAHDYGSAQHLERVARVTALIADRLGLADHRKRDLQALAKLHDLGKVGIHAKLLHKKGPLSAEEKSILRTHSEIGHRIATRSDQLTKIARLILHHHEYWNGSGYPSGLREEAIPLECRIMSLADAFDAMTSARPYRDPVSALDAIEEIRRLAGVQFDPALVEVFYQLYQDGSLDQVYSGSGNDATQSPPQMR